MTQRERDEFVNASLDSDAELERSGHLIMAQALTPPHAVSVRPRSGQVSVTDGPFAETKEHLGGFVLIEAHDLNGAIRIAGDLPLASVGTTPAPISAGGWGRPPWHGPPIEAPSR